MKQHIERIPLTKDFMFKNVFGKYGNEDYSESNKVIVIALINFSYYKRPEYHMIAHMKFEENTNEEEIVDVEYLKNKDELVTEKLEMHIIDMKRYLRKEEAKGELSDWLNLILNKHPVINEK